MEGRPDMVMLVSGAAIAALGGLLVLDQSGAVSLDAGWIGAAFAATVGVILVISGLLDRSD